MLADFLTIREHFGSFKNLQLTFMGDACNNAGNSLMVTSAKLGVNFVACGPKELWPDPELVAEKHDEWVRIWAEEVLVNY
jgi:ornithine carbamoyltransferase